MSGRRRTVTKCSIILFRQQKTPASVLRPSQSNSASVHFGRMQRAVTSSPPARFFMHTKSCLALSDYINFKAVEKTGHNRDALAKKINLRWTSCQKSSPYAASILLGANHSREQRRYRRKNKITITYRGTSRDKQKVNVPFEQTDSGTEHRRANEKTEHDSHTYDDNHTYTHTYTNIQIDTYNNHIYM